MAYIVYGDKYLLTSGKLTVSVSSGGDLILTFVTDDVGGTSFDPDFTVSSGTLKWDLGDGSIVHANSFTHVYSLEGNKTVKVYDGSTSGAESITEISMSGDNIVGELDISNISNLGGQFLIHYNPNLTQILNPVSSQTFDNYWINSCNLTGTLDLSNLSGLGGDFRAHTNDNLTQILNPTSSQTISYYYAYNCDLTGTLDVSGLTGLGGQFVVYSNPNLTKILNPISSQTFAIYYAYDCSLNGTLDVSGLTGLGGDFQVQNNNNLSDIFLPTLNNSFTSFEAYDCSLSQTTVDDIFSKFNTYYTANAPTDRLTIDVGGGTNMWPTDEHSNTDMQSLETIFINASRSLTITINTKTSPPGSDWFLPSINELTAMYNSLYTAGVGNFSDGMYWSSSQYEVDPTEAYIHWFSGNMSAGQGKSISYSVRAARSFTDSEGAYSIRDIGPMGGWIFYIDGTTYYEAAPSDAENTMAWSNVTDTFVNANGKAIGTGQNNTNVIIAQEGHTDSAAKYCDDLIITN